MKKTAAFICFVIWGCTEPVAKAPSSSTIDSNTIATGDSTPAILYLDNLRDDSSFTVALDSMGPAVEAADTQRLKLR